MADSIDDFPRTNVFKAWPGRSIYVLSHIVRDFLMKLTSVPVVINTIQTRFT